MNELILKVIGFNLAVSIFYLVYLILYKKDKAFTNRRVYLLFSIAISVLLPFIPSVRFRPDTIPFIIHYDLDELMITAQQVHSGPFALSFKSVLSMFYLLVTSYFIIKLVLQLFTVIHTTRSAEKISINGHTVYVSSKLHGSSFFSWIFVDPGHCSKDELTHICQHENVHVRKAHSLDRLIMEVLLTFNWFNPLLWLMRNSVIENHEYQADSAVIGEGTDIFRYQLSILNQYIGCAPINNQFSSQIKKRIKMLNLSHSKNGRWKIVFLAPVALVTLMLFSCVDKTDQGSLKATEEVNNDVIYSEVEEMPLFNGEEASLAFRKYIAENLIYPSEAVENGVQGKIYIQFVVTSKGDVRLATPKEVAKTENQNLDEVVVVSYKPVNNENPDEKYVELLKNEATRVVLSSGGKWTPAKNEGKNVSVIFTFPINFLLQ